MPRIYPLLGYPLLGVFAAALWLSACQPPAPPPTPAPVAAAEPPAPLIEMQPDTGAAHHISSGIAHGDCASAMQLASADSNMVVDSVPRPPDNTTIDFRRAPKGVFGPTIHTEILIAVLIDTLGKPNMKTFAVVTTTSPWLATTVKASVAKWTFHPAVLAGCKVPRNINWGFKAGKPGAPTPTNDGFNSTGSTR